MAARRKELGRDVALKLLAPEFAEGRGFSERFRRGARVLASLQHPGIVAVHDFGSAGPWFYLAMERVVGKSLRELIATRALGARESLAVVTQICAVLQDAREHGVVHRDTTPENVFVDDSGRVRLLDFGLPKFRGTASPENLTRTDQVMGTVHRMAPEQRERPAEVDHRADIFSLGVVFYELLTGELPVGRFEPPSQRVQIDVRPDEIVSPLSSRTRVRNDTPTAFASCAWVGLRSSRRAASRSPSPRRASASPPRPVPCAAIDANTGALWPAITIVRQL